MYTVSLTKKMIAQHHLPNEVEPENKKHSHLYKIDISLSGDLLDKNGYLIDINQIDRAFEEILGMYQDKTLNDLEEFNDKNPSLENFSNVLCDKFLERIKFENLKSINVRIWENDDASVSYQREV